MSRRSLIVGGVALVGLAALGAAAAFLVVRAPARVERLLHDQLEASLDADVSWTSLSLASVSPSSLGLRAEHLVVAGRGPFAGVELVRIERVELAVDLWSAVVGSAVKVRSLGLSDGAVTLRVDREGRANWDLVKDSGSSGEGLQLVLDAVHLDGLALDYRSRPDRVELRVEDLAADGTARWSGSIATTVAHATIGSVDFRNGLTQWLSQSKWVVDTDAAYDTRTGGLSSTDTRLVINAFPIAVSGSLVPNGDDWITDVRFDAKETAFAPLLSLVPHAYRDSMTGVAASGSVAFSGSAKGRYSTTGDHWPGFDVALAVKDAAFAYPGLSKVDSIVIDGRVHHDEGPSAATDLDVDTLRFDTGGSPFSAHGTVRRLYGNPLVDLVAKGRLDLSALSGALPVPEGTQVPGGVLELDVAFAGARSDFEAPNPDRIRAQGTARGQKVRLVSDAFPDPIVLDDLDVSFSPQHAEIRSGTASFGKSDLSATGRLDNLVGYFLGGDVLVGDLALTSKHLDLKPFQGRDSGEPSARDEGLLVAVPEDLALTVTSNFREVETRRVAMTDVRGTLKVAAGAVRIEEMHAGVLGGEATVSGSYVAPTADNADIDFSVDTLSTNIGETFSTFVTLRQIAPVLEQVSGRYDSGFTLKTRLRRDGTPDLTITKSAGLFSPTGKATTASLKGVEKKLGPVSGDFASLSLGGEALRYVLNQGKLQLSPYALTVGGFASTLQGMVNVADQSLNLTIDAALPLDRLAVLVPGASGKGTQQVVIGLKGSFSDPKVTVGVGDGKGLVEAGTDALQARADQIVEEAKRAADALVAEAEARAARMVRQADNPAEKLAAEAAASVLKSQARKAADRVIDEARAKADALLAGKGGGKAAGGKAGKSKRR